MGGASNPGGAAAGGVVNPGGAAAGGSSNPGGTAAGGAVNPGGAAAGGVVNPGGAPAGGVVNAGGAAAGGMPQGGVAVMPPDSICVGAVSVADPNGNNTGVEECPDGTKNRVQAVQCAPIIGQRACNPDNVPDGFREEFMRQAGCTVDADCNERPNGKCVDTSIQIPSCGCKYPCQTDADCDAGKVCICAGVDSPNARCVTANCTSNDDCASGDCAVYTIDVCGPTQRSRAAHGMINAAQMPSVTTRSSNACA